MTIRMSNLERLTLAEMGEFVTTSRQVTGSAVEPGTSCDAFQVLFDRSVKIRLGRGPTTIFSKPGLRSSIRSP
jgi:hypothetical protein